MPRVKLNQPSRMERLIRGYWSTATAFANVLGCCPNTARAKMENPKTLTLADLDQMNKYGIPKEEIREAI